MDSRKSRVFRELMKELIKGSKEVQPQIEPAAKTSSPKSKSSNADRSERGWYRDDWIAREGDFSEDTKA